MTVLAEISLKTHYSPLLGAVGKHKGTFGGRFMEFPKQTAILNRYKNTCTSELKQTVWAFHCIQCNKIAMMSPFLNSASIKSNVEKTTQTAEGVASAHQQLAAQLVIMGRPSSSKP